MDDAAEKSYWSLHAMKRIFNGCVWKKKKTDHVKTMKQLCYGPCPYADRVIRIGIEDHLKEMVKEMVKDIDNLEKWGFDIEKFVYMLFFLNVDVEKYDGTLKTRLEGLGKLELDKKNRICFYQLHGKPSVVQASSTAQFKRDSTHYAYKNSRLCLEKAKRRQAKSKKNAGVVDKKKVANRKKAVAQKKAVDQQNDPAKESDREGMEQRPTINYPECLDTIARNVLRDVKEEFVELQPNSPSYDEVDNLVDPMDEEEDGMEWCMDEDEEQEEANDVGVPLNVKQEPMEDPNTSTIVYKPIKNDFIRVSALLLLDRLLEKEHLDPVARSDKHFEMGVALKIYKDELPVSFKDKDIERCSDLFVANPIIPVESKSETVIIDSYICELQNRYRELFPNAEQFDRIMRSEIYYPILEAVNVQDCFIEVAHNISNAYATN